MLVLVDDGAMRDARHDQVWPHDAEDHAPVAQANAMVSLPFLSQNLATVAACGGIGQRKWARYIVMQT
jgi:hypothetical protein